jgi:hypothetical protein
MTQQNDFLDRMRIAKPCGVGWERMSGDDRVRFCDQCDLHVYNFSEMTRQQVESLIASTEGRVCARLYRRADGTVLTRDCPVGIRAFRKRASRMAGAALTTLLSLSTFVFGQKGTQEDKTCTRVVALKVKKSVVKDGPATLKGVVLDEMGAVIPGARVILVNENRKQRQSVISTEDGEFSFAHLTAGKYGLEIIAFGFKSYKQKHLMVNSKEALQATATLQASGETVTVGILVDTPQIETSNGTTIIRGEMIRNLPLPE